MRNNTPMERPEAASHSSEPWPENLIDLIDSAITSFIARTHGGALSSFHADVADHVFDSLPKMIAVWNQRAGDLANADAYMRRLVTNLAKDCLISRGVMSKLTPPASVVSMDETAAAIWRYLFAPTREARNRLLGRLNCCPLNIDGVTEQYGPTYLPLDHTVSSRKAALLQLLGNCVHDDQRDELVGVVAAVEQSEKACMRRSVTRRPSVQVLSIDAVSLEASLQIVPESVAGSESADVLIYDLESALGAAGPESLARAEELTFFRLLRADGHIVLTPLELQVTRARFAGEKNSDIAARLGKEQPSTSRAWRSSLVKLRRSVTLVLEGGDAADPELLKGAA